jgi:hypothetical protein
MRVTFLAPNFGTGRALVMAWRRMSQHTLRITIHENEVAMEIKLEGRMAGPWVDELTRVWKEKAPHLASRKLLLDLRDMTYSDAYGTQALRDIYLQTNAELLAGTPWTRFIAEQITRDEAQNILEEV